MGIILMETKQMIVRMVLLLITLQSIDLVVLILMETDIRLTLLPMMVQMNIHLTQQSGQILMGIIMLTKMKMIVSIPLELH